MAVVLRLSSWKKKRALTRTEQELALTLQGVLILCFLGFCALFGLLVLYLVKSALRIDLIPGFSLGVWTWLRNQIP